MIDPSILLYNDAIDLARIVEETGNTQILFPRAFFEAVSASNEPAEAEPFWRQWLEEGERYSPTRAAGIIHALGDRYGARWYSPEAESAGLRLAEFRRVLPRQLGYGPVASEILFQELDYLQTHSIILGRSRKPYDALSSSGSIIVLIGEANLEPGPFAKLKRLGWKKIVTKVGIGLGLAGLAAITLPVGPFVVSPIGTVVGLVDP